MQGENRSADAAWIRKVADEIVEGKIQLKKGERQKATLHEWVARHRRHYHPKSTRKVSCNTTRRWLRVTFEDAGRMATGKPKLTNVQAANIIRSFSHEIEVRAAV